MDKKLRRIGMINSALLAVFFFTTTAEAVSKGQVFWSLVGFSAIAFTALDVRKFYKAQ